MSDRLLLEDVNEHSVLRGKMITSDLGFSENCALPFRVYVWRCSNPRLGDGSWTSTYFCHYVGVVPREDLVQRLRDHNLGTACRYTRECSPLYLVYLMPLPTSAAEAYVFAQMMLELPLAAVLSGRLGGYLQLRTPNFLPQEEALHLQREWRMLRNLCLVCGASDHKASFHDGAAEVVALAEQRVECAVRENLDTRGERFLDGLAVASKAPAEDVPSNASAPAASPAAVRFRFRRKTCTHLSLDELYDRWFAEQDFQQDRLGWLLMSTVLPKLEPNASDSNKRRYLELHTDSPHRCWVIQGQVPRRRQDWKKDAGRHGGGQGDGVFKLRQPFLKRVVLDRYPHILC